MTILEGTSVSPGIGTGKAYIIEKKAERIIPCREISVPEVEIGWQRLEKTIESIKKLFLEERDESNKEQNSIFTTYILMLSDSEFLSLVRTEYEKKLLCIEYILNEQVESFAGKLRLAGDPYLNGRAEDICDVFGRVLDSLLGITRQDIHRIPEHSVVAAVSLNPSDAIILSRKKPAALLLQEGGSSSHLAILARSYRIPAIFGVPDVCSSLLYEDPVIVDANTSKAYVRPDKATERLYAEKQSEQRRRLELLAAFRGKPAQTRDGTVFELYANIGSPEDAHVAVEEGAAGIGLFRTEFLFMKSAQFLSEETQYDAYSQVLRTMAGKPVVIRTLDSGGDKIINSREQPAEEKNPLLGWRAIRFCMDRPSIFKTQLRALLRAGLHGDLHILIPMVSGYDQFCGVLAALEESKRSLEAEKVPFRADIPVGIMIETPAAAVTAEELATVSAFFSVGTNDLTQYTITVDRENSQVSGLYNECHPAVLRLINQTVQAARSAGISVSVCGEMASRFEGAILLAGIGVRKLSMSAAHISRVKEILSCYTIKEIMAITEQVFEQYSEKAIIQILQEEKNAFHDR